MNGERPTLIDKKLGHAKTGSANRPLLRPLQTIVTAMTSSANTTKNLHDPCLIILHLPMHPTSRTFHGKAMETIESHIQLGLDACTDVSRGQD